MIGIRPNGDGDIFAPMLAAMKLFYSKMPSTRTISSFSFSGRLTLEYHFESWYGLDEPAPFRLTVLAPLHYNELAQRMPAYGYILAFVGMRWHMLLFVSSSVLVRFKFVEVRLRALLFAQYVEKICACTKFFDICQRTAHMQRLRSMNAIQTVCSPVVRQRFITSTVAFVQPNCGHFLTNFSRISNVLITT